MTDRNGNVAPVQLRRAGPADFRRGDDAGQRRGRRRAPHRLRLRQQGNQYLVTSYDAATGGNIVNQVEDVYNGLGQLTAEYQSNGGAVDTYTTPVVQYAYTEMAGGVNNSRLTSMTYPDGYVLDYNYGTAAPGRQHQPAVVAVGQPATSGESTSIWAWTRWSSAIIRKPAST